MTKDDILKNPTWFSDNQLAQLIVDGAIDEDELLNHPNMISHTENIELLVAQLRRQRYEAAIQASTQTSDDTVFDVPGQQPFHHNQETYQQAYQQSKEEPFNNSSAFNQHTTDFENHDSVDDEFEKKFHNITTLKVELRNIAVDKNIQDKVAASYGVISVYLAKQFCTSQELLAEIKDDNNFLGSDVVFRLIKNGLLKENDLIKIGIQQQFIDVIKQDKHREFLSSNVMPEPIEEESTEIYFWGMPASGKTCALCAILGTVRNGDVVDHVNVNASSSGYGYMKMATDMFRTGMSGYGNDLHSVMLLPLGTSEVAFYELGMQILDKEGYRHPVTCVDMAGETIRSMYKSNANMQLTNSQQEVLDSLNAILTHNHRPGNRMLHVFVVEYGAENRSYEGLDQLTLLEGAIDYLQNLKMQRRKGLFRTKRYGIFEEDADGIYIMVTKADKMKADSIEELRERTMDYVRSAYGNFYNGLKYLCEKYNINAPVDDRGRIVGKGRLMVIPFSIGNTCFQDYCIFNSSTARKFVEHVLIDRTYGTKDNILKK